MRPPIFIVGQARSGTTLMSSLLDAHPAISILPLETRLFELLSRWPHLDLSAEPDIQKLLNHQWIITLCKKLDFSQDLLTEWIDPTSLSATIKNILQRIGERDAKEQKKQRWGEKSPRHSHYLPEIFDSFPQSKVIVMVRDPRAVLASILKTPWNRQSPDQNAREWSRAARRLKQWSEDVRVRPVFYEQLVTDPKSVLLDLCGWLGEEYTDSMLDRSKLVHRFPRGEGWGAEHRQKAREAITPESIEKWKNQLSMQKIRLVEHICADQMISLGYQPVTNGLGWFASAVFDLKKISHRIHSRLRYEKRKLGSFCKKQWTVIH